MAKSWNRETAHTHPVVDELGLRLGDLGYTKGRSEGGYTLWTRRCLDVADCFVDLVPSPLPGSEVAFDVLLGFQSHYIRDVMNDLRLWECSEKGALIPPSGPSPDAMRIIQVWLGWLMANAAEPKPRPIAWPATSATSVTSAESLFADFMAYGEPFLASLKSTAQLAALLSNLKAYPRRQPSGGPESAQPDFFAAILLCSLNDREGALRQLNVGYAVEKARISRVWESDQERLSEALRALDCRVERYRSFCARTPTA